MSPADTQQTDTYYIVAHFHYVLFGGAVFGLFAGFYYWWPKIWGRMLNERLGKWNFWLMVVGVNLTFGPMHIVGLLGQPRRMYLYPANMGFAFWNFDGDRRCLHPRRRRAALPHQRRHHGPQAAQRPARSLGRPHLRVDDDEPAQGPQLRRHPHGAHASTSSSTASTQRTRNGKLRQVLTAEEILADQERNADDHIHLPSPSYWPLVVAAGLPIIGIGLIFSHVVAVDRRLVVALGGATAGPWSPRWPSEDADPPDGRAATARS